MRVSLEKWSNDEIKTKTKAEEVFDDLKKAVRAGTFDTLRNRLIVMGGGRKQYQVLVDPAAVLRIRG